MSGTPEAQEIIERIKTIRIEKGLSQAKFAALIGVSQGNVGSWETGKALPGSIALKNIALKLDCSVDWLLFGAQSQSIFRLNEQKNEAVFDPDLKRMIEILKGIMNNENPHMRSWAIIQFEKAFAEYCSAYDQKKLHA